ncbi:MAG: retropepsin-like aspartic protease, partial [Armatimonadota bacterium]|nr:retropepsin-like aspartic protease [Armatimonadota bacterium]
MIALLVTGTVSLVCARPNELIQRTHARLLGVGEPSPLQWQGKVQIFYPMSNTGTLRLIEDGDRFYSEARIAGVVTESAYHSSARTGWRKQHGLVLPVEAGSGQPFSRLSLLSLLPLLRQAAAGTVGVVDCGATTLPDGREARWLQLVPPAGGARDIYCDEQGDLLAWGYHESDELRLQPTRFIVTPTEWRKWRGQRLPAEVKVYEDHRHVLTVRWEQVEPVSREVLLARMKPPASPAPPKGLPVTLPFRFSQRLILVEAKLNGRDYVMMLDTGAAITVVDQNAAKELKLPAGESLNLLGASGQGTASVATLDRLQLGGVTLRGVQVAVTDLGLIRLVGGSRFGGILGFNVLNRFRVTVDYYRRTVTLERPGGKLPPGRAIVARFPGATPQLE